MSSVGVGEVFATASAPTANDGAESVSGVHCGGFGHWVALGQLEHVDNAEHVPCQTPPPAVPTYTAFAFCGSSAIEVTRPV